MTTTTNYGLTVHTVGSDHNTWGTSLNNDLNSIDSYLYLTAKGNIGATAPTVPTPSAGLIIITEYIV